MRIKWHKNKTHLVYKMHETNINDVKSYIDEYTSTKVRGWTISLGLTYVPPIKAVINDLYDITPTRTIRRDVADVYKIVSQLMCGWEFNIPSEAMEPLKIELFIQLSNSVWTPLTIGSMGVIAEPAYTPKVNKTSAPSFIVIDNVYENPDGVREFALKQVFNEHKEYHKGHRTDQVFRFPGLKEMFERRLGVPIKNWEKYGTNGCFQFCIAGDQLVYHFDQQEYAGVLFLTPDAPPNTGSSFYRSKHTKQMKVADADFKKVFRNGFLDSTEFDRVDTVGNLYNRIVLFDSKMIHSASEYFGTTKENGRLFQLFFFDLDI